MTLWWSAALIAAGATVGVGLAGSALGAWREERAGQVYELTPRYLGAMLEMSRANLGLDTIDIYYIHNPETQLASIERGEFLERVRRAFEFGAG